MHIQPVPSQVDIYSVSVRENEFSCDGGKKLPYATTIGTFGVKNGRVFINVWMPAAYTPRGYKAAADRKLRTLARDKYGADPGHAPKRGV